MVPRSLRLTGEEDYAVSRLTGQRAPELGLTGGAIPEDRALRMQYRELMEAATRTGCGGEGYLPDAEDVGSDLEKTLSMPSADDIITAAEFGTNEYYLRMAIEQWGESGRGLAGDLARIPNKTTNEHFSLDLFYVLRRMYIQVLRSRFPGTRWRTHAPQSLWDEKGWEVHE